MGRGHNPRLRRRVESSLSKADRISSVLSPSTLPGIESTKGIEDRHLPSFIFTISQRKENSLLNWMRKFGNLKTLALSALAASWIFSHTALAATPSPTLVKAKKEADARGYTFISNRDEIVTKAKQEGRLRVLAEMEPPNIKASVKAFMKKYPFINLHIEEITGTDAARRNILEIKSGMAKDWDILHLSTDFYNEYLPHVWKIDILGMAQSGVLQMPIQM